MNAQEQAWWADERAWAEEERRRREEREAARPWFVRNLSSLLGVALGIAWTCIVWGATYTLPHVTDANRAVALGIYIALPIIGLVATDAL